jgi:Leucine-rich repeat (LRR) protein
MLDLGENQLDSAFPADFAELVNLRRLFLQHNKIQKFPSVLRKLKNLHILKLNDNGLTELDSHIGMP